MVGLACCLERRFVAMRMRRRAQVRHVVAESGGYSGGATHAGRRCVLLLLLLCSLCPAVLSAVAATDDLATGSGRASTTNWSTDAGGEGDAQACDAEALKASLADGTLSAAAFVAALDSTACRAATHFPQSGKLAPPSAHDGEQALGCVGRNRREHAAERGHYMEHDDVEHVAEHVLGRMADGSRQQAAAGDAIGGKQAAAVRLPVVEGGNSAVPVVEGGNSAVPVVGGANAAAPVVEGTNAAAPVMAGAGGGNGGDAQALVQLRQELETTVAELAAATAHVAELQAASEANAKLMAIWLHWLLPFIDCLTSKYGVVLVLTLAAALLYRVLTPHKVKWTFPSVVEASFDAMIPSAQPLLCEDPEHPQYLFACVPVRQLPPQGRGAPLSTDGGNGDFMRQVVRRAIHRRKRLVVLAYAAMLAPPTEELMEESYRKLRSEASSEVHMNDIVLVWHGMIQADNPELVMLIQRARWRGLFMLG